MASGCHQGTIHQHMVTLFLKSLGSDKIVNKVEVNFYSDKLILLNFV